MPLNFPKPTRSSDALPKSGRKVLGWHRYSKRWVAASWIDDANGWACNGYYRQPITWWMPQPPAPPEDDGE